jgi:hypothetical protein
MSEVLSAAKKKEWDKLMVRRTRKVFGFFNV